MEMLSRFTHGFAAASKKSFFASVAFLIVMALIGAYAINECSGMEFWQVAHNACITEHIEKRMTIFVMSAYASIGAFSLSLACAVLSGLCYAASIIFGHLTGK